MLRNANPKVRHSRQLKSQRCYCSRLRLPRRPQKGLSTFSNHECTVAALLLQSVALASTTAPVIIAIALALAIALVLLLVLGVFCPRRGSTKKRIVRLRLDLREVGDRIVVDGQLAMVYGAVRSVVLALLLLLVCVFSLLLCKLIVFHTFLLLFLFYILPYPSS